MDEPNGYGTADDNTNGDDPVIDPAHIPGTHHEHNTAQADHDEPIGQNTLHRPDKTRWQKWKIRARRSWRKTSWDRLIELAFAGVIVLFSILQYVSSGRNNLSTSNQVGQLVTAANLIQGDQKQLVADNKTVLDDNRKALATSLKENREELEKVLGQNRAALLAQTSAANGQLSAVQQQTEVAERPWVYADIVPSGGPTNESGDALRFSNDSVNMQFKFTMKNVGKSVALDVQPVGKLFTLKGVDPFSQALTRQAELCGKYKPPPNPANPTPLVFSTYLFPGDHKEFTLGVSIPYKELLTFRWPQEEGGRITLEHPMFIGCVEYRFSFGKELHHMFFNLNVGKVGLPIKGPSDIDFKLGESVPAKNIWITPVPFGSGNYVD